MLAEALRWLAPPLAAAATAALFDRRLERSARAGGHALPPGLERPGRRLAAGALLAGLFYLTLFAPLALPADAAVPADLSAVPPARLFLLHAVLVAGLGCWLLLAWGGAPRPTPAAVDPLAFLGLRARDPAAEVAIGLVAGVVIWAAALGLAGLAYLAIEAAGGGELLPKQAPRLVAFLAGQPVWLRLAVSVSAGAVEELFFRGFLQPRLGIWVTTALFVLAHAAYGAPAMFFTVALLSLAYGWLARRRGGVWAAAAAHAVFDAVQLLVVLPAALREIERPPLGL